MRRLNEAGDTMVEILLALAITSSILVGTLAMTNHSFRQGQAARERSQATSFMQQQAEALHNYRDTRPWTNFNTSFPIGSTRYLTPNGSGGWNVTPCNPVLGNCHKPGFAGNTGQVWVEAVNTLNGGNKLKFRIRSTWEDPGNGGPSNSEIFTFMVNLDDF